MREQERLSIYLESEGHRALRRCHGCGAYARPFEFDRIRNVVFCERCVVKARRERQRDGRDPDPNEVDFLI